MAQAVNQKNEKKAPKKERRRIKIGQFFKEVFGEVKKLTWLSKKDLASYTLAVLAFIALMAIVVYALDLVFGEGLALLANL